MAQTRYKRPFDLRLFVAIWLTLLVVFIVLFFTVGSKWYIWLILGLDLLFMIISVLMDPATCRQYVRHLHDGTEIRVKRPFIGFRKYETEFGLTGGYEVSADGWRYEKAYWRI